ncbi:MAG: hypothetical protein WBQ94_04810 [Terracidiphilus sp.]
MRPIEILRKTFLLLFVPPLVAPPLTAQTLQRHPPSEPESKPPATTSSDANPASPPVGATLPAGTNLQVEIVRHYPMKAGEAIEGRLVFPVFAGGRLVVPQNTQVQGRVVTLRPDKATRWHARLRGDFTPFHVADVQFNQLMLPGGPVVIATSGAAVGSPVVHLYAPGVTPRQSVFSRYWNQAKSQLHDRVVYFTSPGLGDRALQLLYHQLPYHPERIEAKTTWSTELKEPLPLSDSASTILPSLQSASKASARPETWPVNALLTADLSSASAKPGDPVQAVVVEPVFDKDRQLVVPQSSVLIGKVTTAKAARSLGRNGKLRFTFQEVRFPEGTNRPVEGSLAGADAASHQSLSLDAEGTISPRNQSSVIAPLLLTVLAGRALDEDGNFTAQAGVASNGFGLVGRVVGVAAGSRNLAAGIGYYAAALSFYENFLHPGRNVVFPRNTRIEIETSPLRAPVLAPKNQ